ncbi:MAG: hypothetical protein JWO86_8793 [Myxococcaceae bacterium]|nr:hypothetical protein [Myxococcaceae bacterium]
MKRTHLVLFASLAGVLLASVACGTLLAITPEPEVADGGAEGVSATEAATDAGDAGPITITSPDGKLGLSISPSTLDLVAGDATPRALAVTLTRQGSDPVTLSLTDGTDLTVAGMTSGITGANVTLSIGAVAGMPRRLDVGLIAKMGVSTVVAPLTVLVARHYREGGSMQTLTVSTTQTFLVQAWGGGGGLPLGSGGGYAEDLVVLQPGEYLVVVGTGGGNGGAPGSPGGGAGISNVGGGGGYSGLFAQPSGAPVFASALVVAGAGGGGCSDAQANNPQRGGAGGSTGSTPAENGGSANGAGGLGAGPSTFGNGGASGGSAGSALRGGSGTVSGGGGGGGYWGGGGGGATGGGGGGSSYAKNGGLTQGGMNILPGHSGAMSSPNEMLRANAGNPGSPGAVLIIPK